MQVNPAPEDILATAEAAAREAALFLRNQEGTQQTERWSEKGVHDFVTEVDRESERMIARRLTTAFPGCVILGEELSPEAKQGGLTFVVDPLDGTTNFLHAYPYYAVSIGALLDGELVAGVVHHVQPDIAYTASRGGGARQNGVPIAVSRVTQPGHALIGTGFPFKALDRLPLFLRQFDRIMRDAAGVRRAGSAALDLCDVAAGRFDGFWELLLAPWDIAAGALIVREAGGVITGLEGEADVLRHGPIVAGNTIIHRWLLEILKEVG